MGPGGPMNRVYCELPLEEAQRRQTLYRTCVDEALQRRKLEWRKL